MDKIIPTLQATPISVFWFRRDLRLQDNTGLFHALTGGLPVLPVFIFDTTILDRLPDKCDPRVDFIHQCLTGINEQLRQVGSSLHVVHGEPFSVFRALLETYNIRAVYTNHDYEPAARKRDEEIRQILLAAGVGFHTFKDQVVLEKNEVVRDDGQPYTVFTPYSKKWKKVIAAERLAPRPSEKHPDRFVKRAFQAVPTLASIGFHDTGVRVPPPELDPVIARDYHTYRDFPARQGTTGLSVHLRFGTISIRDLACRVSALNETLLNELIWREFYMMILWHFPYVAARAFRPAYDHIVWRNNEEEFAAWMEGRTGYPIVDAGMRQLNETGYMHNRVRMIVASFLVKHLLIDWRWGEQYFASRLMDFDQSANNGGWQWAAGSGCDAAPYFRIFNPALQTAKFDPDLRYIRQWVPELDQFSYPQPVVNHEMARKRCIDTYKKYLNAGF